MDVDTGTDDAVALLALHALKELDIKGLSAVNGNCSVDMSYRNTRCINRVCKSSYPVYKGAEKPLFREAFHAALVHGKNGLGDVDAALPENETIYEESAWDALYAEAKKEKGELRLIATGPLTNIAIALMRYPDLPKYINTLLIMGGATMHGNITPSAEFNIHADPEAADIVFKAGKEGLKIVMCPLDATEKAYLTEDDLNELKDCGNEAGSFVYDVLQKPWEFHKKKGNPGVEMHDSCPVLYLVKPEIFDAEEAGVVIETKGEITLGKTVTDLYSDKQFEFNNALVVLDIDRRAFRNTLKDLIRSV